MLSKALASLSVTLMIALAASLVNSMQLENEISHQQIEINNLTVQSNAWKTSSSKNLETINELSKFVVLNSDKIINLGVELNLSKSKTAEALLITSNLRATQQQRAKDLPYENSIDNYNSIYASLLRFNGREAETNRNSN
jgi:uncharacterized membrane protein YcgQ (UPF0703/DUF1980 family)